MAYRVIVTIPRYTVLYTDILVYCAIFTIPNTGIEIPIPPNFNHTCSNYLNVQK